MGRPGCKQCCDDQVIDSCIASDEDIDLVYRDSNNQIINKGLQDIRDFVRTSEDQKPENAPEDYDDFVIKESVLRAIEDGNFAIVKEDQTPQIIQTTFYNEGAYSFEASFFNELPHTQRMEVKTKGREFFFRHREIELDGDKQRYSDIEIKDISVEIPSYASFGFTGRFPSFTFRFSPDIVDIEYDGGFCFNMKEELGSYLTEEELERVEFSIFLDPQEMAELSDVDVVNAADIGLFFDHFHKFSVYKKDLTSKETYMIIRTPNPVSITYKDHRVVGGDFFFADVNTDFIDDINEINRQTPIRQKISELFSDFLETRKEWTIVDSGFADAATKTQFQDSFLTDAKEYIEENYEEITYTKVAYIGDINQERNDLGFRIRESEETVDFSDSESLLDSIFEDENFLEKIVGEVEDIIELDLDSGLLIDFSYRIKQGDSTSKMVFKDNLLSSTNLPRPSSYTFNNSYVKANLGDNEYYSILPRIGTSYQGNYILKQLRPLSSYREKYYISIKYTSPSGAFLNGEESSVVISKNDELFGDIDVGQERKIGKQIFVDPLCGYITSRTTLRLPAPYDGQENFGQRTNIEHSLIYAPERQTVKFGSFSSARGKSSANMSCLPSFISGPEIFGEEYNYITDRELTDAGYEVIYADISGLQSQFNSSFSLAKPNLDVEQWKHFAQTAEYREDEEGNFALFPIIAKIREKSSKSTISDFKEDCESIISLASGKTIYSGSVSEDHLIASSYTHLSMNYDKFTDNSVKTANHISQWPSKSFYTIDMEPNKSDLRTVKTTSSIGSQTIINRIYLGSNFVSLQDTFSTNGLYNSNKMYSSIKVNSSSTFYISGFVPSSYHSVKYTNRQKSGTPNTTVADSFSKGHTISVNDLYETLDESVVADIILMYESNIAQVEVKNREKTYYLGATFSSESVSESGRHKDFFSYIDLLTSKEGAVQDYSFTAYDDGSFLSGNYDSIHFKPLVGQGTLSNSLSSSISSFFNQHLSRGPDYRYVVVWEEDGPFLDADISYGFGGITSYELGEIGPRSFTKNECVDIVDNECLLYDCESCQASNGLIYNLNDNNFDQTFDERNFTYIPVNSASLSMSPTNPGDYVLSTNLKAFTPSTNRRYLDDNDRNNILTPDGISGGSLAIKLGDYSGPAQNQLVNDTDLCNVFNQFIPSEGVGGFIPSSSPGSHVYKNSVYTGDYYYYDYSYNVTDSIVLRNYATHGSLAVNGKFASTTTTAYLFAGQGFPPLPINCGKLYGPFTPEECLNAYLEAREQLNDENEDYTYEGRYVSEQSSTTYNFIPCRDTYFFVEDQSYTRVDIRGFGQESKTFKEDPTEVSKNTKVVYTFTDFSSEFDKIEEIPFNNIVIRWSR